MYKYIYKKVRSKSAKSVKIKFEVFFLLEMKFECKIKKPRKTFSGISHFALRTFF